MKILFLYPKVLYSTWPYPGDFLNEVFHVGSATFPQIAASVSGHEMEILDARVSPISKKKYLEKLRGRDVVCLSVVSPFHALNSELTIKIIKKINPETKIILGGHHSTFYDREWVNKGADIVIRREGDITFKETIEALDGGTDLSDVSGITYSTEDGEIRVNPDRELIANLDSLPLAKWELINYRLYNAYLNSNGYAGVVESSRGCPHPCNFCVSNTMWYMRQRYKSPERVFEEIARLRKLGITQILISDDNFGENPEIESRIFEKLLQENIDVNFFAFIRADNVLKHPELFKLAGRAGLRLAAIGYETDEAEALKTMEKGLQNNTLPLDYKRVYEILYDAGVYVSAQFLGGYPLAYSSPNKNKLPKSEICDSCAVSIFIPMRGVKGLSKFEKMGVQFKDMFYHERFLSAYTYKNRRQANAKETLGPGRFIEMASLIGSFFSRNYVARHFSRGLVKSLFSSALKLNKNRLLDFFTCINPMNSPDEAQKKIVSKYLNDEFVKKICE